MGLMMADYYLHPERSPHVGKKKALYIYGYGGSQMSSSVEKLKRELPEHKFEVMCHMPVTTIPGGHRLSDEALPIIKDVLMQKQQTS